MDPLALFVGLIAISIAEAPFALLGLGTLSVGLYNALVRSAYYLRHKKQPPTALDLEVEHLRHESSKLETMNTSLTVALADAKAELQELQEHIIKRLTERKS